MFHGLFFTYLLLVTPMIYSEKAKSKEIEIVGHRGARAIFPENSLESISYAMEFSDWIEIDVHLTKDGVLAVTHDPVVLDRGLHPNKDKERVVYRQTYEELSEFDCGSVRDKSGFPKNLVSGSKIPRLEEVLDLLKTKPEVGLVLEIKFAYQGVGEENYPPRLSIVNAVFEVLKNKSFKNPILIQSFDIEIMKMVLGRKSLAPFEFKTSYLYVGNLNQKYPMPDYDNARSTLKELQPDFFGPNHSQMAMFPFSWHYRVLIDSNLSELGIGVIPWTVNKVKEWKAVMKNNIAGIITDDPEGLRNFLQKGS
jgi:glycerophosphoryl diester phosphodiesterase